MAMGTNGLESASSGQGNEPLPLKFSVRAPHAATLVPPQELQRRVVLSAEQCVIDGSRFYLRGRVVIPIADGPQPFVWGVWAQVSAADFFRTQSQWKQPGREAEPPYAGWLDTDLPLYGVTLHLDLLVHTQIVGRRPHFQVAAREHPLAAEQRNGITMARARQIATSLMQPASPGL